MDYAMQQSGGLTDDQFKAKTIFSWEKLVGNAMELSSIELWYKNQWSFTFKHQSFWIVRERNSVGITATQMQQVLTDENRRVDEIFTKNGYWKQKYLSI
jgi:hypothetical protein